MSAPSTILVTGGAGFIGSHACVELLDHGYELIVVDDYSNSSQQVFARVERIAGRFLGTIYELDIRDRRALSAGPPEWAVSGACQDVGVIRACPRYADLPPASGLGKVHRARGSGTSRQCLRWRLSARRNHPPGHSHGRGPAMPDPKTRWPFTGPRKETTGLPPREPLPARRICPDPAPGTGGPGPTVRK
jgi:hypothetical protein